MRMVDAPDVFIGPVNLDNPGEFTILELAEKVIRLTGSRSRIISQPLSQDAPPLQRKPGISLTAEKLGWTPAVNLEEGLMRTIAYFDKYRSFLRQSTNTRKSWQAYREFMPSGKGDYARQSAKPQKN